MEPKPLLGKDGAEEGLRERFLAAAGTTTGPAADVAPVAVDTAVTADAPGCTFSATADPAAIASSAPAADASAGSGGTAVEDAV